MKRLFKDKIYHCFIDIESENDEFYYGKCFCIDEYLDDTIKVFPKSMHIWEDFCQNTFDLSCEKYLNKYKIRSIYYYHTRTGDYH